MLDLRQGLDGNHLYSFNPVYQRNNNHDFDFWDRRKNRSYENFDNLDGNEVEFQAQTIEDGFEAYSPPLWRTSRGTRNEVYPLLPHAHRCYDLSPRSRTQAIARGRLELMELIQNMPESSYELSLKDIVDQESFQEVKQEEIIIEDTWFDFKTEAQMKQMKKKNKNTKKGPIARSRSMDSGTFLLKMFFPTCLSVSMKSSTVNRSKVSARSSLFEGSEKHVQKEWWKKIFSFLGENKISGRNGSVGSTSSSNSNRSRHADSKLLPGCWPALQTRKSKTRKESGCIC